MASRNEVLKSLRVQKGLTQSEIASIIGISQSSYAMIESGQRLNPRREVQKNLSKFFERTVDEIFFDSNNHELRLK